jgi:putative ABC transport system permease protein
MLIKVKPGQEKKVAAAVSKLWRQFYPNKLLEIKWVDDMLAAQYKTESRLQQLFSFFSGLSMFLAALGVLGLIIQATAQRKKEIGIRKVLGASVTSIVRLFSIDFVKLVLIAVLIASPVAWWLMNKWLLDFAYRIHISGWVFIIAGAIAVIIALLTISIQAIKAAMANPIKSLRTE